MKQLLSLILVSLALALPARAQHHESSTPTHPNLSASTENGQGDAQDAQSIAHPSLPLHPAWAREMLAIIGVMFVSAWIIGLIVRANMPDEVPNATSHHDDAHTADGAHGHAAPAPHPHH